MQKKLLLLLSLSQSLIAKVISPHAISLFFENYPELEVNSFKQKPLPKNINPINGIPVSYYGYQCSSNKIGHVTLPRKHQEPSFTLVVTEKIYPIIMTENTLYGWQLTTETPYAAYTIKRKKDPQTKLFYWDTKKTDLKEINSHVNDNKNEKALNNKNAKSHYILPTTALIITANPQDIIVEEGATVTTNQPQLTLPTMYVKRTINNVKNALYALENRLFFDPLQPVYQVASKQKEITSEMKS